VEKYCGIGDPGFFLARYALQHGRITRGKPPINHRDASPKTPCEYNCRGGLLVLVQNGTLGHPHHAFHVDSAWFHRGAELVQIPYWSFQGLASCSLGVWGFFFGVFPSVCISYLYAGGGLPIGDFRLSRNPVLPLHGEKDYVRYPTCAPLLRAITTMYSVCISILLPKYNAVAVVFSGSVCRWWIDHVST
jgi:hypothetical protein